MDCIVEICAASFRSASAAWTSGAARIELCSELGVGGVTPSSGLIGAVRSGFRYAVNVLVRPRSGDFLYSSDEAETVLRDIAYCAACGVQGVVVGALTPEAEVDRTMTGEWLREAHRRGLSVTFHRAIDRTADLMSATDTVASMGFDRLLTSGGCPTAHEGMENIRQMVRLAGKNLIIMPGSGVNPENIREIVETTGVKEIHLSASRTYESGMKVLGGIAEKKEVCRHSDPETISRAIAALIQPF